MSEPISPGSATSGNSWSVVKGNPACGNLGATILQISEMEKPRCSAAIDQMRLRRAMGLPLEFQYFSSSGFQSEIQVLFSVLIGNFLSLEVVNPPGAFSLFHRKKNAA